MNRFLRLIVLAVLGTALGRAGLRRRNNAAARDHNDNRHDPTSTTRSRLRAFEPAKATGSRETRRRRTMSTRSSRRRASCSCTRLPRAVTPNPHARVIKVMHQFREDYRTQEILAAQDKTGHRREALVPDQHPDAAERDEGLDPGAQRLRSHRPSARSSSTAGARRSTSTGTASAPCTRSSRSARPGWRRRSATTTCRPVRPLPGPVPRRLRRRDERLLEAHRVARRRRRRHPRHEHAAAARAGGVARLRSRVEPTAAALRRLAPLGTPIVITGLNEASVRRATSPSAARNEPPAAAPREARRRAADRVAAGQLVPAAARDLGDRDAVEPVEETVARTRGAAVPALGGRDRRPAAMACRHVDRLRDGVAVEPDAPHVRATCCISSTAIRAALPIGRSLASW